MPVTDVTHDIDSRTLTITADFAAPVERVFEIYADPRQLERIWGPPSHPATVVEHDFVPGGAVHYFMTSPEGEKFYGIWRILTVDRPRGFTFEDAFADDSFAINEDLPVSHNDFQFVEHDGGTRGVFVSTYATVEGLEQVLAMGVVEGATLAINQVDDLLAETHRTRDS